MGINTSYSAPFGAVCQHKELQGVDKRSLATDSGMRAFCIQLV
jgi:hypothetical protein